MITEQLANRALRIHESAYFSKKLLAPKGASPLSALVASINSFQETGDVKEIVAAAQSRTSTIGSFHEIEDEISKSAAKIISRIIHVSRNVVNPKIKEAIEEVEKWKSGQAGYNGYSPVIQQIEFDSLFTDEMFLSMIKTYANSNYQVDMTVTSEIVKVLEQALLDEDRVQLLTTGTGSLDAKVTEYLNKESSKVSNFFFDFKRNPTEMGLGDLVMYFMFLNGVCTGRNDKVLGVVNNSVWLAELCNLQANIGNRLNMVVNRFAKAVSDGDIFVPVGIRPEWLISISTVTVIGSNYRKWLENKGTPEAMIGYCISKKDSPQTLDVKELKERSEFYADLYQKEMNHQKLLRMNEELYRVPQIIGDYLTRIINKTEESDDTAKINLINKTKEAIKRPYYGNDELHCYVRDVICDIYTEGDDVKMVLSNIDTVLKESGNGDLEYAVYVSICRLVGRWIARQADTINQ